MYNRRHTPEMIRELAANEIFVFGSNLAGFHGGGAARAALNEFGAIWGQGVGLQGQSYAIPTMQGGVETIKPYVDEFIDFARAHTEYTFLVTRIACGIAGFTAREIAPLFAKAIDMENVILPEDFVGIIQENLQGYDGMVPSWNAKKDFLVYYNQLMQEIHQGNKWRYQDIRSLRAKEYSNTIELCRAESYITETRKIVLIPHTDEMIKGTLFYSQEFRVDHVQANSTPTTVEVNNADCISEGIRLIDLGYNPAILNMASRHNPGGGVMNGAGAQEEGLFRRTNLHRSLYQFTSYAEQYGLKRSSSQYPMHRDFGGIYTPYATLFREGESLGYKLMDYPREMSFISVAGINRPELDKDGWIADWLVESVKNKMRTIFRIGLKHSHDSLVLGALGCGAFANPPQHIARLFHEVMNEAEFANKYKLIVFAILDDHNSHREHNPKGNFTPFKEEFVK